MTATSTLTVTGNSIFSTASSTGIVKFSQINSDTGAISFGDENLSTTGTLSITGLTTLGNASTTVLSVSPSLDTQDALSISMTRGTTNSSDYRALDINYTNNITGGQYIAAKIQATHTGTIDDSGAIPTSLWVANTLNGNTSVSISETRPLVTQLQVAIPAGETYTVGELANVDSSWGSSALFQGTLAASDVATYFAYTNLNGGEPTGTYNFTRASHLWGNDWNKNSPANLNITYNVPIRLDAQTAGTNTSYIAIGTAFNGSDLPTGNYAIYDKSGYNTYLSGSLALGGAIDASLGKLSISDATSPRIVVKDTTNSHSFYAEANNVNVRIGSVSASDVLFMTNETSRLKLNDSTGNVEVTGGAIANTNTATTYLGGTIYSSAISSSTLASSAEQTLHSYTLPAGAMSRDGAVIKIRAWGITGPSATYGDRTIKCYFGSALVSQTGAILLAAAQQWDIEATVIRGGASAQEAWGKYYYLGEGSYSSVSRSTQPNQSLANTVEIKCTGTHVNATATGITQKGMIVELVN